MNVNDASRSVEKKKESRVFEYEYKISNMTFSEETNSADRRAERKCIDDRFRRHSDSTHLHSESNRNTQIRKYSAGTFKSAFFASNR